MFESVIEFFNTSLATLTIYDILVTILFALALILTIASGLIILSAKVKKINLEIEKNKSIQFINEKIIQNRLDLILNKLRNTEHYLKNNQSTNLSSLTNNNIKASIIDNEAIDYQEDLENISDSENNNSEIISIPYIKNDALETTSESNEENSLGNEEQKNNDVITYNFENNNDNKKFDDGQSIPINVANNSEILNNQNPTLEEATLETNKETSEQNVESTENTTKDLVKANDFLNSMDAFKNDDKFEITESITDDGTCIKCFVRNEYYQLTYKELIRQLLIQSLITHYNYPLKMISLNYRLSRSIDVAIIRNHVPYIIALIDYPNKAKRIQLLKDLALASNAKFAIWCNGKIITCYSVNNGYLEEISDIPKYQENTENNASYSRKDRNINKISYNNGSFYKDRNNIYRNTNKSSLLVRKPYSESSRSSGYTQMSYDYTDDNISNRRNPLTQVVNSYNASNYFSKYPYGPYRSVNQQKTNYRTTVGGNYTGGNLGYLNNSVARNQNSNNDFFFNRMR